jgi:uncharacterized damage-inducible protein DinB
LAAISVVRATTSGASPERPRATIPRMSDHARPYRDLLAYQLGETRRWHAWLTERPAALAVRVGEGRLAAVRDLAAHVVTVDLRYAQRLRGQPVTGIDAMLDASWPEVGTNAERAAALLDDWLAHASPADLDVELTFQTLSAGTLVANARSVIMHALVHGTRHWAQIATELRQQGWRQDWRHDYIIHRPR